MAASRQVAYLARHAPSFISGAGMRGRVSAWAPSAVSRSPLTSTWRRTYSMETLRSGRFVAPSSLVSDKREIREEHLISNEEYLTIRTEAQQYRMQRRKLRRALLGPYASLTFECYDFLWTQIQEMLVIEGGGEEQVQDELDAYRPLVPNGRNIVFTLMFEIDKKPLREQILSQLEHVEETVQLRFAKVAGGQWTVSASSTSGDAIARTSDGRTSAVHFLSFVMSKEQAADFKAAPAAEVAVTHDNYGHSVKIQAELMKELKEELA